MGEFDRDRGVRVINRNLGDRRNQVIHVKETISLLIASKKRYTSMKFATLKALIVTLGRVFEGASPGRYTAMVRSYMGGSTNDTDVLWHL